MRRVLILILLSAAVLLAAAGRQGTAGDIDLKTSPQTLATSIEYEVGESYTLGNMAVPEEVVRPVSITGVEILHSKGIEVLGVAAFEPRGEGIGGAPGWPPRGYEHLELRDALEEGITWSGAVAPVIGVRHLEARSGLRGLKLSWVDGHGAPGSRTWDLAVVTCSPGACTEQVDPESLLRQLGLMG
ncbi:MAG: hypothetical protein H0U17_00965 [Actinobacteria bacterium]|nr:hypothetical protein [Actinomycetota bacterium]